MEQSPYKKKGLYNTRSSQGSSRTLSGHTDRPAQGTTWLWVAALALGSMLPGCAVQKEPYLENHVGRATEQDVRAKLGEPRFMQPGEGSGIRWVYREGEGWFRSQSVTSGASADCVEYHLTFDSRKVLVDWTKTPC